MQRDGVAPPQVLRVQPRLPVGLVMYLEAFYELDSERVYTVTMHGSWPGRIPWSKIISYAVHYGMDDEETLFFIRKMDDAFIEQSAGGSNGGPSGAGETVQRPPRPD
jgi:hypothetical protein